MKLTFDAAFSAKLANADAVPDFSVVSGFDAATSFTVSSFLAKE